jgi:hypothetical protein
MTPEQENEYRIRKRVNIIILLLLLLMAAYLLYIQPRLILWQAQWKVEQGNGYTLDQRKIVKDYQLQRDRGLVK